MKKVKRYYSREKRKEHIIGQFNIWHHNGDDQPKTMQRIARALGMIPSMHFKNILDEMVMEGKMTVERRDKSGRWTGNYYLVIKSLITEKYGKRRITVKRRGTVVDSLVVPAGQMRLFS